MDSDTRALLQDLIQELREREKRQRSDLDTALVALGDRICTEIRKEISGLASSIGIDVGSLRQSVETITQRTTRALDDSRDTRTALNRAATTITNEVLDLSQKLSDHVLDRDLHTKAA